MVLGWTTIAKQILVTLSPNEKEGVAVYLDKQVIPSGTLFVINRNQSISRPYKLAVAFVDLEPMMNWSHPCRYLLINVDNGEIEVVKGEFPPFFYKVTETLHLIWKGASVPNWALAVENCSHFPQ
jgi:hypothetical protein